MLKYNFKYELKLLLRSNWILLLSVFLLLSFGFSIYNGTQKTKKIETDILAAKKEAKDNDELMIKLIDSVEQGLDVSVPYWTVPTSPMAVGNYYPRVAAKELRPLAFIATGQADLFTHYVKPTTSSDDFALNFTEMTSPTQLLFGSFDLAFVIVYLLPLLIIAFSYNVLSAEKESGIIRLLASQPIKIKNWVLQKLALRFFWLSILVIVSLLIVFLSFGITPQLSTLFGLIAIVLSYMLFWFVLAFLINIGIGSSAKNAVSLLGIWVFFVMLVPSILNQVSNSLYPIPSRTLMISKMRNLNADLVKKQDEVLDNYLRDHPEYAINDSTQSRTFWHSYMATKKLVKEELKPITDTYTVQLQKQQDWLDKLKWVSPAIIVQESLNKIAGTSTQDYKHFKKQAVSFSETWREHFMPFLYNNKNFTISDYDNLPSFHYVNQKTKTAKSLLIILGITIAVYLLGVFVSKRQNVINGLIISK